MLSSNFIKPGARPRRTKLLHNPYELQQHAERQLDPAAFCRDLLDFHPDPRQAELLALDAHRVLLNCTRQWGKSTLTAALAVRQALLFPECLTLVLSPSARQSSEFLRKAHAFARELDVPPRGDGDNEISLLFPNGSRIVGLPGAEATVRAFSAVSLMLIDEAARVSGELYKAVRPMLAVGGGHLWLMSTPCGQRGFFFDEWTKGASHWTRFSVPATQCPRIPPEFLEEERATLGDRWFRQEYLCEFVDADDTLFPSALVHAALCPDVAPLFPSAPSQW